MSRDVSILKFSNPYASVEEIPDDEAPHSNGTQEHVHTAVKRHFQSTGMMSRGEFSTRRLDQLNSISGKAIRLRA